MDIKDWLIDARKSAQMTQDSLAEALGVTRGNVSAWENGRHEPSISQIRRIGSLCRHDPKLLFDGDSALNVWPFSFAYEQFMALPEVERARIDGYALNAVHRKVVNQGNLQAG